MLEAIALAALVLLTIAYGDTDRSAWLFVALVAFFATWAWQAIDAYRLAVARGAAAGGAIQALALAPLALVVFTGFWLLGGRGATPNATLQRYVAAWRTGNAEVASSLFAVPPSAEALRAAWSREQSYLADRLATLRAQGAVGSDQGTGRPLDPLVFVFETPAETSSGRPPLASAAVEFVRQETVSSSFFGLFPAATQRTRVVERAGEVRLTAVARPTPLGSGSAWAIESVDIGPR